MRSLFGSFGSGVKLSFGNARFGGSVVNVEASIVVIGLYDVPSTFVANARKEYVELGVSGLTVAMKVPVVGVPGTSNSATPVPPRTGFGFTLVSE